MVPSGPYSISPFSFSSKDTHSGVLQVSDYSTWKKKPSLDETSHVLRFPMSICQVNSLICLIKIIYKISSKGIDFYSMDTFIASGYAKKSRFANVSSTFAYKISLS